MRGPVFFFLDLLVRFCLVILSNQLSVVSDQHLLITSCRVLAYIISHNTLKTQTQYITDSQQRRLPRRRFAGMGAPLCFKIVIY